MKENLIIKSNEKIARDTYELILSGSTEGSTRPGQFVQIAIPGVYLRRPISVCDYGENSLTLVYKTVGKGTELLSRMGEGERLELLTGLGNGFHIESAPEEVLLAGGGAGVPPLYRLAKDLIGMGKRVHVALGFNTACEAFYQEKFSALGAEVYACTTDGTCGEEGLVTSLISAHGLEHLYTFACGPLPMLKALSQMLKAGGQFSMEERMGCGFGACMGCTIETKNGYKRVCKDGPVFLKEELLWQTQASI